MKRYGKLIGWGAFIPENVVTNYDLEKRWDTTHEWIAQRTGITERRYASEGDTTASMATAAAKDALAQADIDPNSLDLIVIGTCLTEYFTPSVANMVQYNIGAENVPAFDLSAGCTGFVYALNTAYQFIQNGVYHRVLVIGVENISRMLPVAERDSAVLFGDAAGAVILEGTSEPCGIHGFMLGSDGNFNDALSITTSSKRNRFDEGFDFKFKGRKVFRFASRILKPACEEALSHAGLTFEDIDWIIPHQANTRIVQSAARDMGVPFEKFYMNIERFGNTSAASIPLALYEGLHNGAIKPTDTVLIVAFGAGLTWGAAVWQMQPGTQ